MIYLIITRTKGPNVEVFTVTEISEGSLCGVHAFTDFSRAVKVINKILEEYHDAEGPAPKTSEKELKELAERTWDLPGDEMGQSKLHFFYHKI